MGSLGGSGFGVNGRYITEIKIKQLIVNGMVSSKAIVTWSDGSNETYRPGDKNIPQEVINAAPDIFKKSGKGGRKNNHNKKPPSGNNHNKKPSSGNNHTKNGKPLRPGDINMNIPKMPETKKPKPQPKPKPNKPKRDQKIDYGVHLEKIDVSNPGVMLFPNEKETRISTYSSHKSVLSNSKWQTIHRAMNRRFNDPHFDLSNKKKCLFGRSSG